MGAPSSRPHPRISNKTGSKHIPNIQVEIKFICHIAVSQRQTYRTYRGIIIIAQRGAKHRLTFKNLAVGVTILGNGKPVQDETVLCHRLLRPHLCGEELVPLKLYVSHSGKGQLLFDAMSKPFATHDVAQDNG